MTVPRRHLAAVHAIALCLLIASCGPRVPLAALSEAGEIKPTNPGYFVSVILMPRSTYAGREF